MPITTNPEWQQMALYAGAAALVLLLLFNLPYVGRAIRALFSFGLLAFALFIVFQQAPFDPDLARVSRSLGVDGQQVVGEEVRIRLARDGHFWTQVEINGVARRMLVDSGATVTALSQSTADAAAVTRDIGGLPVMMRTANGTVRAETGTIERLGIGGIEATALKVVISPALGNIDVLGMNFLSQLAGWRVEDNVLIMRPRGTAEAS
ncbi:aspartyl protease family protein [Polymorphobacter multimanifer]|uniref:Aspartyl protease family protein n=1 Tax=Polymorphobacter multimanifer TaxID=1070431 RepID=A0A841L884_9SPHN|nr:TIGR02281 family clan AA aspartic protease [Polymorphobacter multimanifer]MBB6227173.1 aspartyl protease family protein [Polymorphobacter multimanifer]